ncbi:SIS domain-containing protein [Azospirillum sp. BE72]|uniref:SIS domain-containing protein n=1 Tax=Azospirillum sp. BE72 TaxID=2817776 RepID=UPI00285C62D9|nr:SIS domain-containing protein [Azospirillum sp. BE72]MDR6774208.1 D-sedoheptulose 7-phosphate isomerase [Azospirillum sp. BE72]
MEEPIGLSGVPMRTTGGFNSVEDVLSHADRFFAEVQAVAGGIDRTGIENMVKALVALRTQAGRLFFVGVGGSAANCSHAVNDFRKLCRIEAYSPVDNVAELTARTNDEGWDSVFAEWLAVSRAGERDALFVLSVGGGDSERGISTNIVRAVDEAKARGMTVFGIVGRASGHTAKNGDHVIVVPDVNPGHVTPLSEAFQAVIWHCLVSHPALQSVSTKWESAVNAPKEIR